MTRLTKIEKETIVLFNEGEDNAGRKNKVSGIASIARISSVS